jgi:hypothetical protein
MENREIGIVAKRDSHHSRQKGAENGDCPSQRFCSVTGGWSLPWA